MLIYFNLRNNTFIKISTLWIAFFPDCANVFVGTVEIRRYILNDYYTIFLIQNKSIAIIVYTLKALAKLLSRWPPEIGSRSFVGCVLPNRGR